MLSVTVQYALRALALLAGLPEGQSILGRDLAKQTQIPANYLSKIMWTLGGAGLVEAMRGSGGGYRLRRLPQDIRLSEIVGLFERQRLGRCCLLDIHKECTDEAACSAHKAWQEIGNRMNLFLETTTLADIATQQQVRLNRI